MNRTLWLGVLLLALGLAAVAVPGLSVPLPSGTTVPLLVAAGAAVAGVGAVRARLGADFETAELSEPETRPGRPTPGDEFDDLLASLSRSLSPDERARRRRVRERVEGIAIAVLQTVGDDEETARRRLETGSWTDDETATALFADRREYGTVSRLQGVLVGPFRRRVARAVAALESVGRDEEEEP
ncbi:hypothetical protein [Halosegnis sp.]|uniref:DUF7269 family protein n=1 Tax=Halosegnis sp. TaxID=2864959 RepID=UPI0035D4E564